MIESSAERILRELPDDAVVLDVGGGADPFRRADWVLDLMRYDERGLYGATPSPEHERFGPDTWTVHDMCAREPWPFADGQFDFAVCSHTLEDVRDPVWVCSELSRVAKAGYVETPSRLEEQTAGLQGPWVGWSHHRWIVEVADGRLEFVFKHHVLCGRASTQLPRSVWEAASPEERVLTYWWTGRIDCRERIMTGAEELDTWLEDFAAARRPPGPDGRRARWRRRLGS